MKNRIICARNDVYRIGTVIILLFCINSCQVKVTEVESTTIPAPDFTLTAENTHNRFSRLIPPVLTVPDGSVVEAYTNDATGGQFNLHSTLEDDARLDMDRVHDLTGPIYVEGAEPGDVLAIEMLDLEPGDWGWTSLGPDYGFLAGEHDRHQFKTYELDKENNRFQFSKNISIPMRPFAGVMGVAPDTDSMLVTFPPRANGGNMDDPFITKGVTLYLPVFVEGALFSIGDPHAVQGLGEVVGTAVECPMRIRFRLSVKKDMDIEEPQYESGDFYATTGYGETIDEAAKKATRFMIQHLIDTYDLGWEDAYMLCSLVGDLHIAEVVDLPNMLVTMHIPKSIFTEEKN